MSFNLPKIRTIKFKIAIISFLCIQSAYGQNDPISIQDQLDTVFDKNYIYLFCRGTKSKGAIIGSKFNHFDKNITHIGIGFYTRGTFLIYNVTDNGTENQSALVIDSVKSFINLKDIFYFSIWGYKASAREISKALLLCKEYTKRKIFFDMHFNIQNDDTLYCSEFCSMVLKKMNPSKFSFNSTSMALKNDLYESILGRKILIYFPVDFFQQEASFKKLYECYFNNADLKILSPN